MDPNLTLNMTHNEKPLQQPILHQAASINGNSAVCELLLRHGACVNCKNTRNETALVASVRDADDAAVCKVLLQYKACPTQTFTGERLQLNWAGLGNDDDAQAEVGWSSVGLAHVERRDTRQGQAAEQKHDDVQQQHQHEHEDESEEEDD